VGGVGFGSDPRVGCERCRGPLDAEGWLLLVDWRESGSAGVRIWGRNAREWKIGFRGFLWEMELLCLGCEQSRKGF
jgi:hypothetical protein